MFELSWYYLYGVGGLAYVLGTIVCVRAGVLDLGPGQERTMFIWTTSAVVLFAAIHALFQFVFPYVG